MRLELWLSELVDIAGTGLAELLRADSDAAYRHAAERVADALEPYVCDTLIATCPLDREPR